MLNPPSPGKSILGMRQVSAPAAGPAPSVTPDIGTSIRTKGDNAAAGAPGYTNDVPNEVPESGLDISDVKKAAGLYGFNALAQGNPFTAIPTTAMQLGIGGAVKWGVNKAKNALGFGPKTEEVVPGWESPHFGAEPPGKSEAGSYAPDKAPTESVGQGWDSSHFGTESGVGGSITGAADALPGADKGWFDGPGGPGDDNVSDSSSAGPSGGGFG